MKEGFPAFFFDCPTVTTFVDSPEALEALVAILMARHHEREQALNYLMCALTCEKLGAEVTNVPTFGYDRIYVDVPTLGECWPSKGLWLARPAKKDAVKAGYRKARNCP
jgi:hypothetical protein